MKVAFLVNDLQLSGGIGVVVAHARELAAHHGFDARLVLVREQEQPHWPHHRLDGLPVLDLAQATREHWDVAIATWWETALALFALPSHHHVHFVQSLEDRFYPPGAPERAIAGMTLDLPVAFVTEARWIAETLDELRPDASVHLVRNGIDKATFASPQRISPATDGPLRVLVEGNAGVWFKGVPEAIAAVRAMTESHHLTVVGGDGARADGVDHAVSAVSHADMAALYAQSHVVLKLSRVEGMYGPPLEGFHMGATCVTTQVTGHEEYVHHAVNALIVEWDDQPGTTRALDLLARDRRLLHELRVNALHTARAWPSWRQAGQMMATSLQAIGRAPSRSDAATGSERVAAIRAAIHEAGAAERRRREAALGRPVRLWRRVRHRRGVRIFTWPLRRALRRGR